MSTLEDKLAAGIAQVKNTSRTRKTPAKVTPEVNIPAALSVDNLPASVNAQPAASLKTTEPTVGPTTAPTVTVKPVVTEAPKRIYLADERVWPD